MTEGAQGDDDPRLAGPDGSGPPPAEASPDEHPKRRPPDSQPELTLGTRAPSLDVVHVAVRSPQGTTGGLPEPTHRGGDGMLPSGSHAFLGAPMSYAPAMSFNPSPSPVSPPSPAGPTVGDPPGFGAGPHPPSGWTPYWRGSRLVDPRVSDADRTFAIIMHLWWVGLFSPLGILCAAIPVVLWAVRQSSSSFVDDHGREAINMQLTGLILAVSIFGIPFLPVWGAVSVVNSIRGAVAAGSREHFRYGMILRPIG